MSQPSSSSQSRPYGGEVQLFITAFDSSRLNFVVCRDQDFSFSRLQLNRWYTLRNFKMSESSYILDKNTSLNSAASKTRLQISPELLQQAQDFLNRKISIKVLEAKSKEEYSRVSLKGKIYKRGPVDMRRRKSDGSEFSIQKFRLKDETASVQVTVFGRMDLFTVGQCYLIHNGKTRKYGGRSFIEVDTSTITETVTLTGVTFSTEDSDDESEVNMEYKGVVNGIVYGSATMYEACNKCNKKECSCDQGRRRAFTAKLDLTYDEKNIVIQVFTRELGIILGRTCEEIDSADSLENGMDLSLPCDIDFTMKIDQYGKQVMQRCQVTRRWNLDDA